VGLAGFELAAGRHFGDVTTHAALHAHAQVAADPAIRTAVFGFSRPWATATLPWRFFALGFNGGSPLAEQPKALLNAVSHATLLPSSAKIHCW